MREWILKAVNNRDAVNAILSGIDPERLSGGQILVTPNMLKSILKIISDGKFEISNIAMQPGGGIGFDIRAKNSILLRYSFKVSTALISRGQLILKAKYTEEKLSSGGISGAFMNLSGKNGLELVLGKNRGIYVDGTNVEVNKSGLPDFINCSYLRATPGGLVFAVQ